LSLRLAFSPSHRAALEGASVVAICQHAPKGPRIKTQSHGRADCKLSILISPPTLPSSIHQSLQSAHQASYLSFLVVSPNTQSSLLLHWARHPLTKCHLFPWDGAPSPPCWSPYRLLCLRTRSAPRHFPTRAWRASCPASRAFPNSVLWSMLVALTLRPRCLTDSKQTHPDIFSNFHMEGVTVRAVNASVEPPRDCRS
jgi:hypothetical protein